MLTSLTRTLKLAVILAALLPATRAMALSIDWSGGYRIEYHELEKPTLGADPGGRKSYGQHLLYLTPTIVPADGFTINTRLNVLNNTYNAYKNSQEGAFFGEYGGSNPPAANTGDSNVYRDDMGASAVQVSQLYLTYSDELATLKVGRQPYEFGLGMTYNAGNGMFDHWYDTYDMLSYKIMVGSVSVTPMIGQLAQEGAGLANKYQVQMLELKYDNAETGSLLGLVFERRNASATLVKDDPANNAAFFGGTAGLDYSMNQTSFLLGREWASFGFKIEGAFQKGNTGVVLSNGSTVGINAYGVASEFSFHPAESRWSGNLRVGMASGDDPGTRDNFEGFQFDRNYDVAFLLFNYRLGNANTDYFRTNVIKDQTTGVGFYNSADDETISNVSYISPKINYVWSDKLDLVNTFTYAQLLNKVSNSVDMSMNLGLEWDLAFVYKPREKVRWVNQIGWLFPGDAWSVGRNHYGTDSTYGFESKAAISF